MLHYSDIKAFPETWIGLILRPIFIINFELLPLRNHHLGPSEESAFGLLLI